MNERHEVEIHLADGRVLSGPRGASVGEFLRALDFPVPVVAADVDGQLRELTFPDPNGRKGAAHPIWRIRTAR